MKKSDRETLRKSRHEQNLYNMGENIGRRIYREQVKSLKGSVALKAPTANAELVQVVVLPPKPADESIFKHIIRAVLRTNGF